MTIVRAVGGADAHARVQSLIIMIAGMVWLALIAWLSATLNPHPFSGYEIYDVYYATFLDGRIDLPPRTIRFEGHYAPDGTAFMYHGVAPLLTRFAFGWFWPFEKLSMSGPSIWFWAILGTAGYHSALIGLARRANIWEQRQKAILFICVSLWFAGPALLLVANQTFFHEPIAVAFGATGIFVAIWVRMAWGKIHLGTAAVLLALLAVITFHARPHVALALYFGTAFVIGWGLWCYRVTFLFPALLGGTLLGTGIAGYMALNEARFGSPTQLDGGFQNSEIIYGMAFWGLEDPVVSRRAQAVEAHGRFNVLRVAPNAPLYLADVPPNDFLEPISNEILDTYRKVTEPILGFIRIEPPRIGIAIVWPIWLYLSLLGIRALRDDPPMATLAFCMALSFGLMLSYATVTFRYRIDLWPLLGVLALLGALRVLASPASRLKSGTIIALFGVGFLCSHAASYLYSGFFRQTGKNIHFDPWTYQFCIEQAQAVGFKGADLLRICREPVMGGP